VKTNKSDYKPGSKVLITASDFSSDATIQFEVLNLGDDGVQDTADDFSYKPWSVTDGLRGDSDSAAGTVGTTWIVPGTALNSTLLLTAREAGSDGVFGTVDDVIATTTFTDAPPASSVSVRLDQWADGPAPDADGTGQDNEVFVNGNLNQQKAHYNEGDSIPYRALLDDLNTNTTYGLKIQWDTVDSGAYAIDYLTGFNFSFEGARHPGEPDVTPAADINDVAPVLSRPSISRQIHNFSPDSVPNLALRTVCVGPALGATGLHAVRRGQQSFDERHHIQRGPHKSIDHGQLHVHGQHRQQCGQRGRRLGRAHRLVSGLERRSRRNGANRV
jgi:hypothetical protein